MIDQTYVDKLRAKIEGVEAELAGGAAGGPKLRSLMAEHRRLKRLLELGVAYLGLRRRRDEADQLAHDESSDDELRAMAREELAELEQTLPAAEKSVMVALLPPDPANERNVIMEIRAGTGGDEAALFAADLFRMYTRYAEGRGWKIAVLDASPSNVGGYKEVIFSVEGQQVYQTLRYESGVHRVQRVPVTEASGRIHTSAATVAVLPEADELDDDIQIRPEDLRIDTFRSSGAGGQHVNTTDSAIRITHLPTGLVAQSQEERSQHRNRDKAMRVLKAKLLDIARTEEMNKAADARRSQIGTGDRSERIRTYNFPQNRVTDHRINLTLYNLEFVIQGSLDELLEALYDADITTRLAAQMSKE